MSLEFREKVAVARDRLLRLERVVVAFSGGVDSSYLAWLAHQTIGDRATAALASSASLPESEYEQARTTADAIGIQLDVLDTDEMNDPRYRANQGDRCYWCRSALVDALVPLAREREAHLVYGAIADDLGDIRPGMNAASERGMTAPLLEAGLTKSEIRELAREAGLEVWDKPAAACLSSRILRGLEVTPTRLKRVERAEDALKSLGFSHLRVRDEGDSARIEFGPAELARALSEPLASEVVRCVRQAGYADAFIDPQGYRPGGRPLPAAR